MTSGPPDEPVRPAQLVARQGRALSRYVRWEVHPYSDFWRKRLDQAGLGPTGVQAVADLARLPPLSLDDVDGWEELVLRPTEAAINAGGGFNLRWHAFWARLLDHRERMNRSLLDPMFKPIHWIVSAGLLFGYSADDLDRLGELGRRWLELAGVRRTDRMVAFLPPGPSLPYWQLVGGSRRGGVPVVHLPGPPAADDLRRLEPTVLVGEPDDLVKALTAARRGRIPLDDLRAILVAGPPPSAKSRTRLEGLVPDTAAVTWAWAPPGVRALWTECRGGGELHTWPDTEVVEVIDAGADDADTDDAGTDDDGFGRLLWTPIGWRGSVVLRLDTGVAARLGGDACRSCGTTGPRLVVRQQ